MYQELDTHNRSTVRIYQGHIIDQLGELPDESVHCVVTSPPYWGLRKYSGEQTVKWPDGWEGCFGHEPTPELYVKHTVEILANIWRVLREDGTVWWNLGDSYNGSGGDHKKHHKNDAGFQGGLFRGVQAKNVEGLKPLDLVGIPEQVVLALRADGWYWRSTIIWAKPNPMPESVQGWRWERCRVKTKCAGGDNSPYFLARRGDTGEREPAEWQDCPGCPKCSSNDGLILRKGSGRPTSSHEVILMLTKTDSYFFDTEAVKEDITSEYSTKGRVRPTKDDRQGFEVRGGLHNQQPDGRTGRNIRNVWTFPTQPFPGSHFATFPEELPKRCILASTSEKGVCPECGSPWARVVSRKSSCKAPRGSTPSSYRANLQGPQQGSVSVESQTLGWRPTCSCNHAPPVPAIVLDPFSGSGTTALVADKLKRSAIGIDLAYSDIAIARITKPRGIPLTSFK